MLHCIETLAERLECDWGRLVLKSRFVFQGRRTQHPCQALLRASLTKPAWRREGIGLAHPGQPAAVWLSTGNPKNRAQGPGVSPVRAGPAADFGSPEEVSGEVGDKGGGESVSHSRRTRPPAGRAAEAAAQSLVGDGKVTALPSGKAGPDANPPAGPLRGREGTCLPLESCAPSGLAVVAWRAGGRGPGDTPSRRTGGPCTGGLRRSLQSGALRLWCPCCWVPGEPAALPPRVAVTGTVTVVAPGLPENQTPDPWTRLLLRPPVPLPLRSSHTPPPLD